MTIIEALREVAIKDLVRMYNSSKGYFSLHFNMSNSGAIVTVKCTNTYKEQIRNWNGYDFTTGNDELIKNLIKSEIDSRWVKYFYNRLGNIELRKQ